MSIYLNDLIARELEEWNVRSIAGHEIAIQNPQNTFVCDDEQISLFSLQFKDNWLKADSQVMVRLVRIVSNAPIPVQV